MNPLAFFQIAGLGADVAWLIKSELGTDERASLAANHIIVSISRFQIEHHLGNFLQQIYPTVDQHFPVRRENLSLTIRDAEGSDLLDISKIQAGKLQFNPAPFDLYQVIKDAIELISYSSKSHHVTLETFLEKLILHGDAQRIEQVILNLLTNAIRYAPNAFEIKVELSEDNGMAKVGVRDRGIGIPADQLAHIFSRFYRVTENKNVSGLGLGLYLSQQIIERHHGRIWAESTPGEGSVFYFTLPIENA